MYSNNLYSDIKDSKADNVFEGMCQYPLINTYHDHNKKNLDKLKIRGNY